MLVARVTSILVGSVGSSSLVDVFHTTLLKRSKHRPAGTLGVKCSFSVFGVMQPT